MISKTYNNISKRDFYYKFFELFNVLQNNMESKLTERQIDFLSEFLALDDNFKYTRFKIQGKRQVIDNIKNRTGEKISVQNLDATLSYLKKKGILIEQNDRIKYINPKIEKFMNPQNKSFEFIFKFNIE